MGEEPISEVGNHKFPTHFAIFTLLSSRSIATRTFYCGVSCLRKLADKVGNGER
jgi:hypothetical protein